MTTSPEATLRRTPLHAFHVDHGAKMVPFAGWEMPLHYGSIIEEHHQVRRSGGVFDVSHMGRFRIVGRDAESFLEYVCSRQIAGMQDGQARYGLVCNEAGGSRDDVLVYRIAAGEYFMVCNASNREKLLGHFAEVRGDRVFSLEDITEASAMVAVQGPAVMDVVARFSKAVPELKRYRFVHRNLFGLEMMISRTGYTGEDGIEVIFNTDSVLAGPALKLMMHELTKTGETIKPAGLGARDSLRLEAAMALYGHEITEEVDPLSASLDFAVSLSKEADFIGRKALERIKAEGPPRKLVGLGLEGRRAARQGMTVHVGETEIGVVTSGVLSPTLERSIAMAFVTTDQSTPGTEVEIDLGRQRAKATVEPLPFYKR